MGHPRHPRSRGLPWLWRAQKTEPEPSRSAVGASGRGLPAGRLLGERAAVTTHTCERCEGSGYICAKCGQPHKPRGSYFKTRCRGRTRVPCPGTVVKPKDGEVVHVNTAPEVIPHFETRTLPGVPQAPRGDPHNDPGIFDGRSRRTLRRPVDRSAGPTLAGREHRWRVRAPSRGWPVSVDLSGLDWLATCPHCKAKISEHHAPTCKHWGQVLPSECPGYIESVLLLMQRDGTPAAPSPDHGPKDPG